MIVTSALAGFPTLAAPVVLTALSVTDSVSSASATESSSVAMASVAADSPAPSDSVPLAPE